MIPRKSNQYKMIQAPKDFNDCLERWSEEFHLQTGLPKNKAATMRRLVKISPKVRVRGVDFEIIP